jgi:hypothetical protein
VRTLCAVLLEVVPVRDDVHLHHGEDGIAGFERFIRDPAVGVDGDEPGCVVQDLGDARTSFTRIVGLRAPRLRPLAVLLDIEDEAVE